MGLISNKTNSIKKSTKVTKIFTKISIAFLMAITCNLTSYAAYQRPNTLSEIEPNNTKETAQITQPTNEIPAKFAADDFSGRYSIAGSATSSDDDWYKVDLPAGTQYLSVVHYSGDNATYVKLLDSENNIIIPETYGTRYNIIEFDSKGGTYYIHIVGASEKKNGYTLFVGTPMLSSDELKVSFDSVKTSGTIKKSFSLDNEDILPKDAIVARMTLLNSASLGYNGARISSSSSSTSINVNKNGYTGDIGSLNMYLKSTWNIEFYPSKTVTSVPVVDFFYYYPVYDNTSYPYYPTLKK